MYKRQRGDEGSIGSANGMSGCINPFPCVKLRGLPFGATKEEIAQFLDVTPIDVLVQERGGRPSGVAFVLLRSVEDHEKAVGMHKQNLGSRYIEIYPCLRSEYYKAIYEDVSDSNRLDRPMGRPGFRGGPGDMFDRPPRRDIVPQLPMDPASNPRGIAAVVRLRGLPFQASPVDVTQWIASYDRDMRLSQPVQAEDVVVATKDGQSIGIAFVELRNFNDAERLMQLHKKYFGQRYVEVSWSNLEEQIRYTGPAV